MWNWHRTRQDGGKGKSTVVSACFEPAVHIQWLAGPDGRYRNGLCWRGLRILFAIGCWEHVGIAMNSQKEEAKAESCGGLTVLVSGSNVALAFASCTGTFAAGGGA